MLSAHRERILNMSFVLRGCQQEKQKTQRRMRGWEKKVHGDIDRDQICNVFLTRQRAVMELVN